MKPPLSPPLLPVSECASLTLTCEGGRVETGPERSHTDRLESCGQS